MTGVRLTCMVAKKILALSKWAPKKLQPSPPAPIVNDHSLKICFLPDAALPQVLDKTKDQNIIHKDMKDFNSWNSVLDLLVYSKCPIK